MATYTETFDAIAAGTKLGSVSGWVANHSESGEYAVVNASGNLDFVNGQTWDFYERYSLALPESADLEMEITIGAGLTTQSGWGASVLNTLRMSSSNDFIGLAWSTGSGLHVTVRKTGETSIAHTLIAHASVSLVAGDRLKLRAVGDQVTAYKNDVQIGTTYTVPATHALTASTVGFWMRSSVTDAIRAVYAGDVGLVSPITALNYSGESLVRADAVEGAVLGTLTTESGMPPYVYSEVETATAGNGLYMVGANPSFPAQASPNGSSYFVDVIFSEGLNDYNLMGSATPAAAFDDGTGIELGMKFRPAVDGQVKGVRFYKDVSNTGTHVGHLWALDGTLLGTVNFTGESASGWQEAYFATPIAVTAGTYYIVSYHSSGGEYSATVGHHNNPIVNGPLLAPSSAGVADTAFFQVVGDEIQVSSGLTAGTYLYKVRVTDDAAQTMDLSIPLTVQAVYSGVQTVTDLVVHNTLASARSDYPVRWGFAARKGQVPFGAHVELTDGTTVVPVQLSRIKRFKDGSVKLATADAVIPRIDASSSKTWVVRTRPENTTPHTSKADFLALNKNFTITVTEYRKKIWQVTGSGFASGQSLTFTFRRPSDNSIIQQRTITTSSSSFETIMKQMGDSLIAGGKYIIHRPYAAKHGTYGAKATWDGGTNIYNVLESADGPGEDFDLEVTTSGTGVITLYENTDWEGNTVHSWTTNELINEAAVQIELASGPVAMEWHGRDRVDADSPVGGAQFHIFGSLRTYAGNSKMRLALQFGNCNENQSADGDMIWYRLQVVDPSGITRQDRHYWLAHDAMHTFSFDYGYDQYDAYVKPNITHLVATAIIPPYPIPETPNDAGDNIDWYDVWAALPTEDARDFYKHRYVNNRYVSTDGQAIDWAWSSAASASIADASVYGSIGHYWPTTGGTDGIGIFPASQANALLHQTPKKRRHCLNNAYMCGAVGSVVVWDAATHNLANDFESYSTTTGTYRFTWMHAQTDYAHAGNWFYIPYLMTGEYEFAVLAKAYALHRARAESHMPEFQGRDGFGAKWIGYNDGQVRANAWCLRSVFVGMLLTLDSEPEWDYLSTQIDHAIEKQHYIQDGSKKYNSGTNTYVATDWLGINEPMSHETPGYGWTYGDAGKPIMDSFYVYAWCFVHENVEDPRTADIIDGQARYISDYFNTMPCVASYWDYGHPIKWHPESATPGVLYADWAEYWQDINDERARDANFAADMPDPNNCPLPTSGDPFPMAADDYPEILRMAIGWMAETGNARSQTAWDKFDSYWAQTGRNAGKWAITNARPSYAPPADPGGGGASGFKARFARNIIYPQIIGG